MTTTIAHLADQRLQVVEHPRRVQAVHAGPQLGLAEVDLLRDLHQAVAGVLLLVHRDRVLEVAQQDVDGGVVDLAHRVLRTPGRPEDSFSDDPLRMMRAAAQSKLQAPLGGI